MCIRDSGTADKSWGESDPSARAKAKVDAAFEIMDKLSIEYFCFHDRDLSPEYGSLAETNAKLDEVTDYIAEKMKADPTKKLLWGTAKCFDHPRYCLLYTSILNARTNIFYSLPTRKTSML